MPIYEYACKQCGHEFEHLLRTLSAPAPDCPQCGAPGPSKKLSTFAPMASGFASDFSDSCPTCPSATGGGCAGATCPMAS
jgi:putative FmdB family regulatory protein